MISQAHFIPTDQDELEAEYLLKRNRLHFVRIGFFTLVLAGSLAAVGCTAHPLLVYHRSHAQVDWWLPLWPQHFDLRPTVALCVAGGVTAGLNLVGLVVALVPSPRPRTKLLNIITAVAGIVGLVVTVFGVAYFNALDGKRGRDTLLSWTCQWSDVVKSAPADFRRICIESKFSLDMMVLLVIFEVMTLGLAAWGFYMELKMAKARRRANEKVDDLS
ncbi:MAG: hypothetical protein M1812_002162 [Candelaria pacifica]|nr:MAG: hypothetical protein M1812_002162 [Candelaria pacifica]